MLTQSEVKDAILYDSLTGIFTNKITRSSKATKGAVSGTTLTSGYIQLCFSGNKYLAHRIAFLCEKGEMPSDEVDHIDGNRANNAFSNLRIVSRVTNSQNCRLTSRNKSGVNGVMFDPSRGTWRATIKTPEKRIFLGRFKTIEEAAAARAEADIEYNFSERHGKPI